MWVDTVTPAAPYAFSFESSDVYTTARAVNRALRALQWPRGSAHLKEQALRASDSAVLNIAEGWGRARGSAASKNHFRIARGSIGEVFAALDLLGLGAGLQQDCRRVAAMLTALRR